MTPAPIRIFRDPTRRDVEALCDEKGRALFAFPVPGGREFYAMRGPDGASIYLGYADTGHRPNWRGMLQKLGSDWA